MGLGTLVPSGTICYAEKMTENCGRRYRVRTYDLLGVNDLARRQFNDLAAIAFGDLPIWARFVPFTSRNLVQAVP